MTGFEILELLLPRYVKALCYDQISDKIQDGSDLEYGIILSTYRIFYLDFDCIFYYFISEEPCNGTKNLHSVPWMDNFLMIPGHKSLSSVLNISEEFRQNNSRVDAMIKNGYYPMDAASGLAVHALLSGYKHDKVNHVLLLIYDYFLLLIRTILLSFLFISLHRTQSRSIKVLDLCCCPGSKLHLILSLLCDESLKGSASMHQGQQQHRPLIVGVDISPQRLFTCQSLLRKLLSRYRSHNSDCKNLQGRIILFNGDGSCFGRDGFFGTAVFDSHTYMDFIAHGKNGDFYNKKLNKSARARMKSACRTIERQFQRQSIAVKATDLATGFSNSNNSKSSATTAVLLPQLAGGDGEEEGDGSDFSGVAGDFDYVLVDAECRHDASYRHMSFIDEIDREEGKEEVLPTASNKEECFYHDDDEGGDNDNMQGGGEDTKKVQGGSNSDERYRYKKRKVAQLPSSGGGELASLQLSLLRNGFHHLKEGGSLVYSTCSQDAAQNEDIVAVLLREEPSAVLVPAFPPAVFDRGKCLAASSSVSVSSSGNVLPLQAAVHECLNQESLEGLLKGIVSFTEEQVRRYAGEICDSIATSSLPVFSEGSLPGTITLGFKGGMSGHFIAKITKKGNVS